MKKTCSYCGCIHEMNYVCPEQNKKITRGKTTADRFRKTTAWTKKSIEIRERDLYLCRICTAENDFRRKPVSVHHIVPIEADYSRRLDNDNLITLCGFHHEQAERGDIPAAQLFRLAVIPPVLCAGFSETLLTNAPPLFTKKR